MASTGRLNASGRTRGQWGRSVVGGVSPQGVSAAVQPLASGCHLQAPQAASPWGRSQPAEERRQLALAASMRAAMPAPTSREDRCHDQPSIRIHQPAGSGYGRPARSARPIAAEPTPPSTLPEVQPEHAAGLLASDETGQRRPPRAQRLGRRPWPSSADDDSARSRTTTSRCLHQRRPGARPCQRRCRWRTVDGEASSSAR